MSPVFPVFRTPTQTEGPSSRVGEPGMRVTHTYRPESYGALETGKSDLLN